MINYNENKKIKMKNRSFRCDMDLRLDKGTNTLNTNCVSVL